MANPVSEIITLLDQDYGKVLALFAEFERTRPHATDHAKQSLVEAACTELIVLSQLEQECLYPALYRVLEQADAVEEAEVEQMTSRQLIGALEAMGADEPLYDARFTVLGEYVGHHIGRQKKRLFPLLQTPGIEAQTLLQEMRQRREEWRSEFGLPDHGWDDDSRFSYPYPLHHGPHTHH